MPRPRAHPTGPRPWMPTTRLPLNHPFSPRSSGLLGRDLDRGHGGGAGTLRCSLYICGCSRSGRATIATSPTAPTRPAGPFSSCSPSWRRPQPSVGCCGGRPSTAGTTATRIPSSTCTRRASTASSVLTSAGSSRPAWGHRLRCDRRFRAISGAGVARSAALPAGRPARPADVADRRLAGPRGRLLLEHRAGLAWHLRHQLGGSRRRAPALRDRRRFAQQLVPRDPHHGRGWHNNHHAYQSSVRQGFRWWEYDPTFYALKVLSWFGIVWDLQTPPPTVVRGEQRLGRKVIEKVARQLAGAFPIERIAAQAHETAQVPTWAELRSRGRLARGHAEAFLAEIHLPHMPSVEEIRGYAEQRLARTVSLVRSRAAPTGPARDSGRPASERGRNRTPNVIFSLRRAGRNASGEGVFATS